MRDTFLGVQRLEMLLAFNMQCCTVTSLFFTNFSTLFSVCIVVALRIDDR